MDARATGPSEPTGVSPPAHVSAPPAGSGGGRATGDVYVEALDGHVAVVEIRRGPHNYFDAAMIHGIADAVDALDRDGACRAIVLASEGRNFCAGADLAGGRVEDLQAIYDGAVRLFSGVKPIVAAVQGAAVGGGLGLALVADFRVAAAGSRLSANFASLGFFPGFGLTATLPRLVGQQAALELLYTGARVDGAQALALGLCDRLVGPDEVRPAAIALARTIAASGPASVVRIRRHLRGDLAALVRAATAREIAEQLDLTGSADFAEGIAAMAERRAPRFTGR